MTGSPGTLDPSIDAARMKKKRVCTPVDEVKSGPTRASCHIVVTWPL